MKLPSLLTLNGADRAFGSFYFGFSIQRYPDGKSARVVAPNDLDAADGLAAWPLSHGR
jgi:hypothetical protein